MAQLPTIEDVLISVVDNMRLSGNVENLARDIVNTSVYTFDTDFPENCEVGKFISFDNDNRAEITAINSNTITAMAYYDNTPIEGDFKRLDPYFGMDLYMDITAKYAALGTDQLEGEKLKFPSIEFVRNNIESTEDNYNRENFDQIELLFINSTNKDWNGTQRYEYNYKGVLIPLFNEFKASLSENQYIRNENEITFSKSYFDKANYSQNNLNSVNHFVDIIRVKINGLSLDTNFECL